MRVIDRLAPPKSPRGAFRILEDDVFRRPWFWLGLTRERWRATPFEQRVHLFA